MTVFMPKLWKADVILILLQKCWGSSNLQIVSRDTCVLPRVLVDLSELRDAKLSTILNIQFSTKNDPWTITFGITVAHKNQTIENLPNYIGAIS